MEVPVDFLKQTLLGGVHTKWLMSNFRRRKKKRLFADGYLFGIVDVDYDPGELTRRLCPEDSAAK